MVEPARYLSKGPKKAEATNKAELDSDGDPEPASSLGWFIK